MSLTNDEVYNLATDALRRMLQKNGPDYKFPSDVIWQNIPAGVVVSSTSRPHQPKRLMKDGYLELTGGMTQAQSVVQINRLKAVVTLSKGKSSALRFVHKPSGKSLFLIYNRLFSRLPTIAQKPDNVIQFASTDKFYIFDAKYRIQFDETYSELYGGPGPTTEDVNTMHRYRDAIAIPHPMAPNEYKQGIVEGAVVLFPLPNEDAFCQHKFYKSISQVEIGGLPFLPGTTKLVAEKIKALLSAEFSLDAA